MLTNEQWGRPKPVNVRAIGLPAMQSSHPTPFVLAGVLLTFLFVGWFLAGHRQNGHTAVTQATGAPGFARSGTSSLELSPTPDDFAPSLFRQRVLDRRASGQPLPDPGVIALQEGLQDRQALNSKYFQEILSRDAAIQADRAQLASLAQQLGLPRDRLANPAPPSQEGVGAMLPADHAALANAPLPAAAIGGSVASLGDLQKLVTSYLSLPCPLPTGDERCGQAVDHARSELARGHGLDLNRPDATPTLNVDIAQPFGPTDLDLEPIEQVDGQLVHFHEGVDLDANYDEPVLAAASGTVVFAGVIPSGALTVEIAHAGGLHTLYLHEDELLVQQGQQVQKGQIIGLVGASGLATGPHVHFQVNDPSGKPIDPMQFIG